MKIHLLVLAIVGCAGGFCADAVKSAKFDVRHELNVKIPDGAQKVRVWFTLPQDDPAQKISAMNIQAPAGHRVETDSEGNKALYVELDPKQKENSIVTTFVVERKEIRNKLDPARAKPLTEADREKFAKYLSANKNIVIDDKIKALGREIVGDEKNPVLAARKVYDWVLNNIEYWVKDPANKKASPVGSSEYCLANKTGNCTDFHSLWAALARAEGIPTRVIYGSFFKAELNGKDVDQSYHCWPEFYISGIGWVPHDVAVADIFVDKFPLNKDNETLVSRTTADGYKGPDQAKVDYYFGSIDERRVTWSVGRDLTLSPKQDAGPVNALAKAYVEVDGKPAAEKEVWTRKLTYTQK